ncbi:MAG TPA: amidohydrolase family protein [Actinospica sp.]|nr:amidohydrolase family protein [Actinospica sp.]
MTGGEEASILDCHVHLWDPNRLTYAWLDEAPPLNRAFTADVFTAVRPASVEAIFMEAGRDERQAVDEIAWVKEQAERHPWIRGAVAHVPLERPAEAVELIARHAADPFIAGVRRNVQDEAAGFTEDAGFRDGVRLLGDAGLPFDACVRRHQIPEITRLAAACPHTTIVLDHLGKPRGDSRDAWSRDLRELAKHENVVCKLSGLATELGAGTPDSFTLELLREALDVFGPDRCLYASDWPVMTLATRYGGWLDLVREALRGLPWSADVAVLRDNARRVYRLDRPTGKEPR